MLSAPVYALTGALLQVLVGSRGHTRKHSKDYRDPTTGRMPASVPGAVRRARARAAAEERVLVVPHNPITREYP